MKMRPHILLSVLALAAQLGCSRAEDSGSSVSDDVPVVTTRSLDSLPTARLGEPVTVLGDAGVPLGDVVGAGRLSDGRLVVADGGNSVLHWFAADGRLVGSFGGPGDGPTEFRTIQAMGVLAGDTVWVYDFAHQRVTFVSPDRSASRVTSLRPRLGSGLAVGILSDGTILAAESWSSTGVAGAAQPGLNREPVAYVSYSREGELRDTLTLVPGREVILRLEDGRAVMGSAPLGRSAVHAVADDRLVVGDQEERELREYTVAGRLARVIRWGGADLRVDQRWEEAWRAERLASVGRGERAEVERQLAGTVLPERRPAFGHLLPGAVGGVWVGDYPMPGAEPAEWVYFDSAGVATERLRMPARFHPLQIGGGWVLGVARDAYDVETVELRRVETRQ